jgi:hypothetical protein
MSNDLLPKEILLIHYTHTENVIQNVFKKKKKNKKIIINIKISKT